LKYTQSNYQRCEVRTLSFINAGRDSKEVRHGRKGNLQAIFDTTDKDEKVNTSKGKRQCDITEYVHTEICISVGVSEGI
jgi:hypothetical protein